MHPPCDLVEIDLLDISGPSGLDDNLKGPNGLIGFWVAMPN
jgi:hypothetical protein